jgi:hypothetical protein
MAKKPLTAPKAPGQLVRVKRPTVSRTPERDEHLFDLIRSGHSLLSASKEPGVYSERAARYYRDADEQFAAGLMEAREEGFMLRADTIMAEVKACSAEDVPRMRLAWDAERWYLGKLSKAFSDNKVHKSEVLHGLTEEAQRWLGKRS